MMKLLIIFLFLLVAAWLGWEMHQDPGYVMIRFRHWQIETSLWATILLTLILFAVIYVLIRLIVRSIGWPQQWRLWRKQRHQQQAQRFAELAGCEFIEEKWVTAEEYFHKAASEINRPLLYYIGAAVAAQAQAANARREEYLQKAYDIAPDAEISLGILKAKLQIQGQQWAQATITLTELQAAVPHHPVVKRLVAELNFAKTSPL